MTDLSKLRGARRSTLKLVPCTHCGKAIRWASNNGKLVPLDAGNSFKHACYRGPVQLSLHDQARSGK